MAGQPIRRAREAAAKATTESGQCAAIGAQKSARRKSSAKPGKGVSEKKGRQPSPRSKAPKPPIERHPIIRGEDACREEGNAAPRGRPTAYSEELAEEVCRRLANGETLNSICRSAHVPARSTIMDWACQDRAGFSRRLARARDLQLEFWADQVVDCADDSTGDYVEREGKDGSRVRAFNAENVNRSRLRVDARKWLLSRLKPEKYGELSKLELSGRGGGPVQIQEKAPRALMETARRIVFMLQRANDEQNGGPQHLLIDATAEPCR